MLLGSSLLLSSSADLRWTTYPGYIGDAITFGNGYFFASKINSTPGGNYSTDGKTWVSAAIPSNSYWAACAYGGGNFVAIASDNAATNAAYAVGTPNTWYSSGAFPVPSIPVFGLCYGVGTFVAVAGSGQFSTQYCAVSTNGGVSWSRGTMPVSASWFSVAYGNGTFVALAANSNYAAYSSDGISWTLSTLPGSAYWNNVVFGNGVFVASGDENVGYSTDNGATWTAVVHPNVNAYGAAFGDNAFVVGGYGTSSSPPIYSKDNGLTWHQGSNNSVSASGGSTQTIAFGNGVFVAVGGSGGVSVGELT